MPDYDLMLVHVDGALASVKKAVEDLHPINKITQVESYVLGSLRAAETVLLNVKDNVQKTKRMKDTPPEDKA